MELFEALYNRRSIRKYKKQEIPKDLIKEILTAGMYAPSAVNKQPWEFIVLDDKEVFKKVIEIHPNSFMLEKCDKAILVCGDIEQAHAEGYLPVDCSAATQNILLAAHGKGLGACWIGIYPREERIKLLQELFKLPDNIVPFAMIALGYPDQSKEKPNRFHAEKIHWGKW
jgi:nitroreductase